MKNKFTIILIFACLCRYFAVNAQQYTVGVPVYDTIGKGSFYIQPSPNVCISGSLWIDTNLVNRVTGVQCYLLITASNFPADSLRKISNTLVDLGPINLGDSILLTHNTLVGNSSVLAFYYGAKTVSGNFKYAIIAEGMPTSANDSFVCPNNISSFAGSMFDGCLTEYQLWHMAQSHNCRVMPSDHAEVNVVNKESQLLIKPNPSQNYINIETNQTGSMVFTLTDITGKSLLQKSVTNGTRVDISVLTPGLYLYRLIVDGVPWHAGKIIKE